MVLVLHVRNNYGIHSNDDGDDNDDDDDIVDYSLLGLYTKVACHDVDSTHKSLLIFSFTFNFLFIPCGRLS